MKKILFILVAFFAFAVNNVDAQTKLEPFSTTYKWVRGNKSSDQIWAITKITAPGPRIIAYVEDGNLYACNHVLHPRGGGKTLCFVFIYTDNNGKEQRLEKDVPYTDTDPGAAYYNHRRDRYLVCKNVRSIEKLSYYEDYEYLRVH